MKNLLYSILAIGMIAGCSSTNGFDKKSASSKNTANDTIRIANDSLEYEVLIIEPGFYSWLVTQPQRGFYSQSRMEISNNFKVVTYNMRARDPLRFGSRLYPFPINYDRTVDYGYEVNYLLFNYFLFFEQKYQQRLK